MTRPPYGFMMDFTPKHDYLVGIDSDGCAFDTMELKHKECFIPNTINYWGLQGVSKYAREAAEFVNLYSKSRGINRFPALVEALEWTNRRPEVKARGIKVDIPQSLLDWMKRETKLGNPALEKEVQRTGDPHLKHTLEWSKAVNEAIGGMVRGVPPFPFVRESLEKLSRQADMLVVSATPHEALQREWEEHDLAKYTVAICGQEIGTKKESLAAAAKYPAEPHADDRRRARRPSGGRGQPCVVLPHQSRRGGGQLAAILRGRASTDSLPACLPASIRRSCWPSSTAICRRSRRGRWRSRER